MALAISAQADPPAPLAGVYPLYDYDLNWYVQDIYDCMSDEDLCVYAFLDELHTIRDSGRTLSAHPYVLRERYRNWCEGVGEFAPPELIPTWEELLQDDWELSDNFFEELSDFEPSWRLFGDLNDMSVVFEHSASYVSAQDIMRRVAEVLDPADTRLLLLADYDNDVMLVLRSSLVDARDGLPLFAGLGDGLREGSLQTYVLPCDFLANWELWFQSTQHLGVSS